MKIQIQNAEDERNYREGAKLLINDELSIRVYDPEPEDAKLCRDLSFFFIIPKLMRLAYEAGSAGEEFEILETQKISWDDLWES